MSEPAWHPDPGSYELMRWWDGEKWTEHTERAPHELIMQRIAAAQLHETQDRNALSASRWWLFGVLVLGIVAVIVVAAIVQSA